MTKDQSKLEDSILSLGQQIFEEARAEQSTTFGKEYFSEKLMEWAMAREDVKVNLFRFVDVFPSLRNSAEVISHAQAYFGPVADALPSPLRSGLAISPNSLSAKMAAPIVRRQIRAVARRFIVAESAEDAVPKLRSLRRRRTAFTIDILGESTVSEAESQNYLDRYVHLIETLARASKQWPERRPIVSGHIGENSVVNISVKLSALYSQISPQRTDFSVGILKERLSEIMECAKRHSAFVYLDMEDTGMVEIIIKTLKATLSSPEFRDYPNCGIVLQTYLRRTAKDLEDLYEFVKERGTPISIRLVKGAYWDTETMLAQLHDWPVPVWAVKEHSDYFYEFCSDYILNRSELLRPAFGSHNIRSLCYAIERASQLNLSPTTYEIQTLYGMAEPIKAAFVRRGYLVREYCPIGEMIPGMGYLVRRLLENTSNEGFLRQGFHEGESIDLLLKRPLPPLIIHPVADERDYRKEFANCPLADFTLPEQRVSFKAAIDKAFTRFKSEPTEIQPIINGQVMALRKVRNNSVPEDSATTYCRFALSGQEEAKQALDIAHSYFPAWRQVSPGERAEKLFRAADLMEQRRHELAAYIVLEAAKPWSDSDADVAEAIDFLRYYAHRAKALFSAKTLGDLDGETNQLIYEPRGTAVVISPWNFPLAIPCGMLSAALVTGNCVIFKPAEQTPLIAQELFKLLIEAGIPPAALAFLPGEGEAIGPYLVEHSRTATIAFTGSKEVGFEIINRAASTSRESYHVKRVIAEMGGKNAIIVDADADLDEAVKGVVRSAFGYQGQKCSACSKVLLVGTCYEPFVSRLREAILSLRVGPISDPSYSVGPVIDIEASARIKEHIRLAKKDCSVIAETELGSTLVGQEQYVAPIAFDQIPVNHPILFEEIFGPVLAVIPAATFEQGLEHALAVPYALTGGVYSRNPQNIEMARREFRIGNLYINRHCTGALVSRQPFGGFAHSGVGSKAGGEDYLLQFVVPRVTTENTIRRGFAPTNSKTLGNKM